ncbi:hypothetical protein ACOMHN_055351 [Nucella lapillus]
MTDIYQERGPVKYTKRCVDNRSCLVDWYLGSSDKTHCVIYASSPNTNDLNCHLCCHGDRCNFDFLPQPGTYYKP